LVIAGYLGTHFYGGALFSPVLWLSDPYRQRLEHGHLQFVGIFGNIIKIRVHQTRMDQISQFMRIGNFAGLSPRPAIRYNPGGPMLCKVYQYPVRLRPAGIQYLFTIFFVKALSRPPWSMLLASISVI
jgi:hypothetical protein